MPTQQKQVRISKKEADFQRLNSRFAVLDSASDLYLTDLQLVLVMHMPPTHGPEFILDRETFIERLSGQRYDGRPVRRENMLDATFGIGIVDRATLHDWLESGHSRYVTWMEVETNIESANEEDD